MPVIYESDEDKYYDTEELKIFKKGSQSGIESRGSGLFIPGIKHGNGLYLPTRKYDGEGLLDSLIQAAKANGYYLPTRKYDGEGLLEGAVLLLETEGRGEGIMDSLIQAGKAVIEGLSNNGINYRTSSRSS